MPTLAGGTNSRPLNDTIAQTGAGIADDSAAPRRRIDGEESAVDAEALAEKLRREADSFLARRPRRDDPEPEVRL